MIGLCLRWLVSFLSVEENRKRVRQRICRHDWVRFQEEAPGSPIMVIRIAEEYCRKCGAER
jgi:hypothetical protein